MGFARILDWIFVIYFATHIPISLLIDFQAIFPKHYYPQPLQDVLKSYAISYKDTMMLDPPAWFKSFIFCELFMQLPFFPVALYAFYKGCKWIRIPAMLYGAHVATTVWAIYMHLWCNDFRSSPYPGPETTREKLTLSAIYFPYFLCPVLMILKCGFGPEYSQKTKPKFN